MKDDRYARQRAVPGIGDFGQERLERITVRVDGEGLEAELAAVYLAGAGVGTLIVPGALVLRCQAHNSTIAVESGGELGPLAVSVAGRHHLARGDSALERGSSAARWAIAVALGAPS